MKAWKNVLVHLDGKREARRALESSLRVAEAFGGRVTAFDCVGAHGSVTPFAHAASSLTRVLDRAAAARADRMRAELTALALRTPVEVVVSRGSAGRALLGCAARSEAALIVKAASAVDVGQMTAAGRAAVHLLRVSPVPVWLLAPRPRSRRVVAALNLSRTDEKHLKLDQDVLLAASRLALLEESELHVVCVADSARDRLYAGLLRAPQYRRYLREDRAARRRSLERLVTQSGAPAVPHLIEGDGEAALERIVTELDAEVVVLGRDSAHERGGVLGGGALAECLLYRAERSVLLVAPQKSSAALRATRPQDAGQLQASHG